MGDQRKEDSQGSRVRLPGTQWTDEEILEAVAPMRVGRKLTPQGWLSGAKVAVCLSWDMDNESYQLAVGNTEPIALSWGEYGTRQALPRILALYDRHQIPGSFYIPGVTGLLYPELIEEFKNRPQHEIGIHGWIHENPAVLNDRAEEERLLYRSIEFWTTALKRPPVGYRAPSWAFSPYTLDLIRKAGFEYDSSAMGMDDPYEILAQGQPTGLVELPVDATLDDASYFWMPGGVLPSAELAFKVYQDEFDNAYEEGGLFMLTMHPMVTGRRSRMMYLERPDRTYEI
jgi:peptidoglycan-N-acetylglucosamine deacetylase